MFLINIMLELMRIYYPATKKRDLVEIAEQGKDLRAAMERDCIAGKITSAQKAAVLHLLDSLDPETKMAAIFVPASMKDYPGFKPKLYQEIYPYLELAYAFEENGNPVDHASKLACIFNSAQEALQYLSEYAKRNPKVPDFVHDACQFSLPKSSPNTQYWLVLAKRKDMLFNRAFLALLPLSLDIEQQIALDKKDEKPLLAELKDRYKLTELKAIAEKITADIKLLQKLCDKYAAGHGETRTPENEAKNRKRLIELSKLYNDRAILHVHFKKGFGQYGITDLCDVRERILAKQNSSDKFLFEHGVDDNNQEIFRRLDRKQAGNNIPAICLDCGNGFYIKKLNVRDDAIEAALGACAGVLSDCCQALGKGGHACAIHGLTDKNSGFYVLFKGDPKNPNIHDEVWGQTWVNRTASGGLVFDSIESTQGKRSDAHAKIVTAAFRNLANELITRPDVPWVNCGAKSGISSKVGIRSQYQFICEAPLDYEGYRDSSSQLMLADKRLLLSLSPDSNNLLLDEKELAKQLQEIKDDGVLPERLRFTIGFLKVNKKEIQMSQLMDKISDKLLFDEEELTKQLQAIREGGVLSKKLCFPINLLIINKEEAKIKQLLHQISKSPNNWVIKQYIEINQKILGLSQDYPGKDAKLLQAELESLQKNPHVDRGILGHVLVKAVEHRHIDIIKLLSEFDNKPDIDIGNGRGDTALQLVINKDDHEIINILLDIVPKGVELSNALGCFIELFSKENFKVIDRLIALDIAHFDQRMFIDNYFKCQHFLSDEYLPYFISRFPKATALLPEAKKFANIWLLPVDCLKSIVLVNKDIINSLFKPKQFIRLLKDVIYNQHRKISVDKIKLIASLDPSRVRNLFLNNFDIFRKVITSERTHNSKIIEILKSFITFWVDNVAGDEKNYRVQYEVLTVLYQHVAHDRLMPPFDDLIFSAETLKKIGISLDSITKHSGSSSMLTYPLNEKHPHILSMAWHGLIDAVTTRAADQDIQLKFQQVKGLLQKWAEEIAAKAKTDSSITCLAEKELFQLLQSCHKHVFSGSEKIIQPYAQLISAELLTAMNIKPTFLQDFVKPPKSFIVAEEKESMASCPKISETNLSGIRLLSNGNNGRQSRFTTSPIINTNRP